MNAIDGRLRIVAAVVAVAPLLLAGCSSGGGGPAVGEETICSVLPGTASGEDRAVRIALSDRPNLFHAPAPVNESERVVFRNIYETLVDVRCDGEVVPSLAASWTGPDANGFWRFRLREAAVFSDGSPVTAAAVIRSWRRTRFRTRVSSGDAAAAAGPPADLFFRANGEREIVLQGGGYAPLLPGLLADPAFAVVGGAGDHSRPPVGSGPWVVDAGADRVAGRLVCLRNRYRHGERGGADSLVFDFRNAGRDGRDISWDEIDMAILRDRRAVGFAAALPAFRSTPLPWDKTCVLLLPFPERDAPLLSLVLESGFRESLARDVAVDDARPAGDGRRDHAGADDRDLFRHERSGSPERSAFEPGLILYADGDRNGAGIAARLAALARGGGNDRGALVAVPLAERDDPAHAGARVSAVVYAENSSLERLCAGIDGREGATAGAAFALGARLAAGIRLAGAGAEAGAAGTDPGEGTGGIARVGDDDAPAAPLFVPLVETRAHLIARRGLAGVAVDGLSAIDLARAGWSGGATMP